MDLSLQALDAPVDLVDCKEAAPRVQSALDSRERPMHCYYEELVIIDAKVAFFRARV